jgi:hypothetical protein
MEELIIIEKSVLLIGKRSGYYERFFQLCGNCKSDYEAFVKLENEYMQLFGCNRYKNYGSFRAAKSYYFKNRQS